MQWARRTKNSSNDIVTEKRQKIVKLNDVHVKSNHHNITSQTNKKKLANKNTSVRGVICDFVALALGMNFCFMKENSYLSQ
jgi:hypothetical protein